MNDLGACLFKIYLAGELIFSSTPPVPAQPVRGSTGMHTREAICTLWAGRKIAPWWKVPFLIHFLWKLYHLWTSLEVTVQSFPWSFHARQLWIKGRSRHTGENLQCRRYWMLVCVASLISSMTTSGRESFLLSRPTWDHAITVCYLIIARFCPSWS